MNDLIQLLLSGGVLRYRHPNGFYVVQAGISIPVARATAQTAVKTGLVRPNGISAHNVYVFAANEKAIHAALSALRGDPKVLPTRPAAVPAVVQNLSALRSPAHPGDPAHLPVANAEENGGVQGGAGALAAHRAQRAGAEAVGKAGCMGCGACAGKGVKP